MDFHLQILLDFVLIQYYKKIWKSYCIDKKKKERKAGEGQEEIAYICLRILDSKTTTIFRIFNLLL